jgi:hypothetical protein
LDAGDLYVLDYPNQDDANYFLTYAESSPRFLAGWQDGQVAIALGTGTSPRTQQRVARALTGVAEQLFPSS